MLKGHYSKADFIWDFINVSRFPENFVKDAFQNKLTYAEARVEVNYKTKETSHIDKKAVAEKLNRIHIRKIQRENDCKNKF